MARAAGAFLAERFAAGQEVALTSKSTPTDLVSQADIETERMIRAMLSERRPDDAVLGEEGDDLAGTSGLRWVVDPLDGTIDFLYGIPMVGERGRGGRPRRRPGRRGVRPAADELSRPPPTATRPVMARSCRGARPPLSAAQCHRLRLRPRCARPGAGRRRGAAACDIRRFGSAALDLVWTAAGRCDAYWERGTKRWDVAAGALVCERAGVVVTPLPARGVLPDGQLAAPPELVDELLALVG